MTNPVGRPSKFGFGELEIGQHVQIPVPTSHDVKRIARAASLFGTRKNKGFRCKTDRATRMMRVTRVR